MEVKHAVYLHHELKEIPALSERYVLAGINPQNGHALTDVEFGFLSQKFVKRICTAELIDDGIAGFPPSVKLSADIVLMFAQNEVKRVGLRAEKLPVNTLGDCKITFTESKWNFSVLKRATKGSLKRLNDEVRFTVCWSKIWFVLTINKFAL